MRAKLAAGAIALAGVLSALGLPAANAEPGDLVEFDGSSLEWCIRDALGVGAGDPVTHAAMEGLTSLNCVGVESSALEGLAAATNLKTLRLAGATVDTWESLSALTSLTKLDLDSSNVTSLEWLAGATDLSDVNLDWTSASDLDVLASKPLTTLSIRSMGLSSIDFLDGNDTLTELHFDDNDVDDISVLHSLPSLTTVTFDWNRVVDVRPLAELSGLTTWSAQSERGTLPAIQACAQLSLTGGSDIDGTSYELFALDVPNDVETFVVPFNGPVTLVTRSGGSNYSARFEVEAYGYTAPCPWPEEYLPDLSFPTALTVNKMATISIEAWGTRYVEPDYRWTLDDDTVAATTRSIVPLASGIGRTVTPSAITRAEGMETVAVTGAPLKIQGVHPDGGELDFVNPPTAGFAATVYHLWTIPGSTFTCTWSLNGVTVPGVSGCTYNLPSSSVGNELRVSVTAHRANYIDRTYQLATATVLRDYGHGTKAGTISGTPEVGKTLTAVPTTYSPTPVSYTYQWTRNGSYIEGATAKTYTLTGEDAGQMIAVGMEPHRDGYNSPFTETAQVRVSVPFATQPTPTITGTKAVGYTLTASRGNWSPAATTYTYQWYRDGKAIYGATKSSYKAVTADGGTKITVKVTAKKSGYTTASKSSASSTVLKRLTATPSLTITGTAKVKNTLTAKTGTWGPGTVTKTYQWYRNGKAISGATRSTYKVSVKDAFASISVKVTGKKSGYLTTSRTSSTKVPVGIKYSSCAALTKDYPGGIAKSSSVRGIVSTTFVSSKLYALNAGRDGDKDGWACEAS